MSKESDTPSKRPFDDVPPIHEKAVGGLISSLVGGLGNYVDDVETLREEVRRIANDDAFWQMVAKQRAALRAHFYPSGNEG